jgi:hypothetical protein
MRRTVEQKTLEGLFYLELCVEDDEPEGYGEDVVAGSALEVVPEHVERIVVALLILDWRQVRWGASAGKSAAPEDPGRARREVGAHRRLLPLRTRVARRLPLRSLAEAARRGRRDGDNAYVTRLAFVTPAGAQGTHSQLPPSSFSPSPILFSS